MERVRRMRQWCTLLILGGLLSACTYQGATVEGFGTDHPITRKFSWFSYVGGEDIRTACVTGAPDRYRFVYNAVYNEQVRSYDLVASPEPGRFDLKAAVSGEANLSSFVTDLAKPDLFAPWRPKVSSVRLREKDVTALTAALVQDGYFEPTKIGLELPSINFYWVVSSCRGGRFHLNAFLWPSSEIEKGLFSKILFSWDFTGVPVNPPRETTTFQIFGTNDEEDFHNYFTLKVGPTGVR